MASKVPNKIRETKVLKGEKHFTASVWILTKSKPRKMLLAHHKKLGRWQQQGGHIEKFENLVDTAIREVREEAGLDISFLIDQIRIIDKEGAFLPVPRFLMEQTIATKSDQPKHYHLDINYVIEVSEQKVARNKKETYNIGWSTKKQIKDLPTHQDTLVVVEELM